MASRRAQQRNPYKGTPARPWLRLTLVAPDGSTSDIVLLADTGKPLALIVSPEVMMRFKRDDGPTLSTNFGPVDGGWLRFAIPASKMTKDVVGFASDAVTVAARASSPDFEGLGGLPLLRLLEYGGDADHFWVKEPRLASGSLGKTK